MPKETVGQSIMDTGELLEFLRNRLGDLEGLPWMSGYSSHGSFTEDIPPSGSVHTEEIGKWLWVKARLLYNGTTSDPTTDRLSGDPYQAHMAYDWVGPIDSAPEKASTPGDLEEWAQIKTTYTCEYTDVGLWGEHQGRWVDDVGEDGTVTIRVAKGRFQDVTPESTATTETVKLG
ncbi:MAG: hypothetical protein ACW99U_09235 [Candidatus Thorarchaeota archaeon]